MSEKPHFPLFNPLNKEQAIESRVFEIGFNDKRIIGCCLTFRRDQDLPNMTFYAHRPPGDYPDFHQYLKPSWNMYHARPFPHHPIWIGATVKIEMVTNESELNMIGATGTIKKISTFSWKPPMFHVEFDEPQPSAITILGYGHQYHIDCYPFQLSVVDRRAAPDEDRECFHVWLADVVEAATNPFANLGIQSRIKKNWLDAEGGLLLSRLYANTEMSGSEVGDNINLIETTPGEPGYIEYLKGVMGYYG